MNAKAISLVLFNDLTKENEPSHYGVLFENDYILCLCCGGYLKPQEYKILENYNGFAYLDQTLHEHF